MTMPTKIEFLKKAAGVLLLLFAGVFLAACDECDSTADCGLGEQCVSGKCKKRAPVPWDSDTGTSDTDEPDTQDTASDTGSETGDDTQRTDPSTETGTEADDTATGTEAGLLDGQACEVDGDCQSGHCGDGFCCGDGECCAAAGDCDSPCVTDSRCGDDNRCRYTFSPCSVEDEGAGCTGDSRCDGRGNCVEVEACTGPYAPGGGFECEDEVVREKCLTECYRPEDCAEGYECNAEHQCVAVSGGLPNGRTCEEHSQCQSGHCGDGFCCTEGECCSELADCDEDVCDLVSCKNNQCEASPIPCGLEDTGQCQGESRCDGFGGCAAVQTCDGAYKPLTTYSCVEGAVTRDCRTSCTSASHCNTGYTCYSQECIIRYENGEGPCTANRYCASSNCTESTGVCCEPGHKCCDSDSQCENGYGCDDENFYCLTGCSSDADCAADGHCDDGVCYPDVENGHGPCDEASDCVSGYCDTEARLCCASGDCCAEDGDCGGFACGAGFVCASSCDPTGVDDDALCASDHHCVDGACAEDIPEGGVGCVKDADCETDNCSVETGVCCTAGAGLCCTHQSDCDSGNPCTEDYCSVDYHCYAVDRSDGTSCGDGLFCNGYEKCLGGECQAGSEQCTTGGTVCLNKVCNEELDVCENEYINDGMECSDGPLFCLGNVYKICDHGYCAAPEGASEPCAGYTNGGCTLEECDEELDQCVAEVMEDGQSCSLSDFCSGEYLCQSGDCLCQ